MKGRAGGIGRRRCEDFDSGVRSCYFAAFPKVNGGESLMRRMLGAILATIGIPAVLAAQSASFQIGTVYLCPGNNTFKVISCAGSSATDQCDVQTSMNGQPAQQ